MVSNRTGFMHPAQRRYWLRIGAGALAVFGIGMVVVSATRAGVGAVTHSVSGAVGPMPLAMLPIRVDGQKIGTLRKVDVEPAAQDSGAGTVRITVQASDSGAGVQLAHCLLVPNMGRGNRRYSEFKCMAPSDTAGAGLRPLGEIVVEPGGVQFDLLAPDSQLARWRNVRASDFGDVKSVHIEADSNGAVIDVRDRSGRKLFHLQADSSGARISVRGDSSRRVGKR
ncbi:MAG TPA: hypothetical protein VFS33_00170 [Gemmatimonadales bacterium]|nr:hypothetical protein [Gemmatimonadales bacterium]